MKNKTNNVLYLGNYFGFTSGHSYDGWVINKNHLSFPILASCCNGNVPKVIVKNKNKELTKS